MQPDYYRKGDHPISNEMIDKDALYVVQKLQASGHKAYLVGGCVRDLLLGYRPKDYDVSTSAEPEEIKQLFRRCFLIGRRFRLAHVHFGPKIIEVSTFRQGDNEDDSLILRDNVWGTEEEDVKRRDFTINGLFFDPKDETIIDYVHGVSDAKKCLLRSIGNPFVRFKQDPVRMIRLLKFRARFGVEVEQTAIDALFECRLELLKSSKARLLEELLRMLESGSSLAFFQLLAEHGILSILLPKFADFIEHVGPQDIYTFLEEADRRIVSGEKVLLSRPLLLSSIVYPIFHHHLRNLQKRKAKPLHLGEILEEAHFVIHDIFNPSLPIPKKISGSMAQILTSQLRFTPMQEKKPGKYRIPGSPDFSAALEFFRIRASMEPGLQKLYEEWNYFFVKHQKKQKHRNHLNKSHETH